MSRTQMRSSMFRVDGRKRVGAEFSLLQTCPACNGWPSQKKKKVITDIEGGTRTTYNTCWRCDGTGKMLEVGPQKDSYVRRQDGLTDTEYGSISGSSVDPINYLELEERAAYSIWMSGAASARAVLTRHLRDIVETMKADEDWSYQENKDNPQTLMLAVIAIEEMEHPEKYRKVQDYANTLGCTRQTWRAVWASKFKRVARYPQEWLYQARMKMGD